MLKDKIKQIKATELIALTNSPGAQYIITDTSGIITECNAGFANLLDKIPVNSSTTFNAFSVTKTATAAAMLKLIEQNKVLLTDVVNPMFSEFKFNYPFTVQQLLSHQAGFADPIPISWIHLENEDSLFDEQNFIRQTIDKNSKQKFKPGTRFSYSSVGYLIIERLIEKISGEPYEEFVLKNILPAQAVDGKLSFKIHENSNHAVGYHERFSFSNILLSFFLDRRKYIRGNFGSWMAFNNFYVNGKAYGGLVGNALGLATYLRLYLENKMFNEPQTQTAMFTEQKGGMSLSWFTGKLSGHNYFCHAGGGGGYYCEIRIYPGLNIASVLLRNKSSFRDIRLLDKIDSISIF